MIPQLAVRCNVVCRKMWTGKWCSAATHSACVVGWLYWFGKYDGTLQQPVFEQHRHPKLQQNTILD